MMHETSVHSINFSRDSEMLVSGSQDGKIRVLTRSSLLSTLMYMKYSGTAHSHLIKLLCTNLFLCSGVEREKRKMLEKI